MYSCICIAAYKQLSIIYIINWYSIEQSKDEPVMFQNAPIVPSHSYFPMFLPITVNLYSCPSPLILSIFIVFVKMMLAVYSYSYMYWSYKI